MNKFTFRIKFILLTFFIFGCTLNLPAFYDVQRSAFPAFCQDCFRNNKSSQKTWIQPCDSYFIESLDEYIKFIPKPYYSACKECPQCRGVGYCLYNEFEWPSDIDLLEEIDYAHIHLENEKLSYPKLSNDGYHMKGKNTNYIKCWDGGYFRLWNHKYSHFFKHFLHYCSENKSCRCYWPETCLRAVNINDKVYFLIKDICEKKLIDTSFSSYWSAQHIKFSAEGKYFENYYYPNSHGMASSLTTYTFFYSQYHQLLISIASYIDENSIHNDFEIIDNIYEMLDELQSDFLVLYTACLKKHAHPKIYYERGMINLHSGNAEEALQDIYQLSLLTQDEKFNSEMTSEMYQQEGQSYNEFGMYDKAVVALTKAIDLDPKNKEAFFERAYAHFELGNFEEALTDYTRSKNSQKLLNIKQQNSDNFCSSLLNGLVEGSANAATEFLPSLFDSAVGLTETLWATAQHPIDATKNFCNICYDVAYDAVDYFNDFDWDKAEDYSEELKDFCCSFYNLSEAEKGQKLGYLIGKNGTDILMGGKIIKGINNLKKLKNANAVCNLEAMLMSKTNKKKIVSSAKKHVVKREECFKNVKIVTDSQNKHIVGKHNYINGRSIFEHTNPQSLIEEFAGTGVRVSKELPGIPGYKEVVDFKEHIGIWKNREGTLALPTTTGTIHYSKKGAHVVPAHPNTLKQ